MTKRYCNEHYIRVSSGVATNEQFTAILLRALKEQKIATEFKVNLIFLGGKPIGYGYLWVKDTRVYNMLLGRKPDGTELVREIDDPNWRPASPETKTPDEIMEECHGRRWADIDEEEESRYTCPKIKIPLSHMLPLSPLIYSPDERKRHRQLMVDLAEREQQRAGLAKTPITIRDEDVPTSWTFGLTAARVGDVQEGYSTDKIHAARLPNWITAPYLKKLFIPYTSNPEMTTVQRVNGRKEVDTYPVVFINDKGSAFIRFDRRTKDSQFVLLMVRRMEITSPDGKMRAVINFNPALDKGN